MEISKNTFQNKFQFNFGVRVGDLKKIFFVFQSLKFKEKYFLPKKNCPSTFQLLVNFKIFLSYFKSVDDNGGWMEEEPHINACRQGWE